MKKLSLGLAFCLLISFQDLNADKEAREADPCQAMLVECNPHVNVTKGSELCNSCFEKCDKFKAKEACSNKGKKGKETFESIYVNYRNCATVCGNPSPSKEKKASE